MTRTTILLLLLLTCSTSYSQCEEDRYRNFVFSDVDLTSDVLYGGNIDYQENYVDLYLDVYEPSGDEFELRPLVIVAHGGSFVFGSKTGADVVPLCQDLAKMGYVTASIQYRLGIPLTIDLEQPASEAVLRGTHDCRAAVRFMRKEIVENGNPYRIDPDRIFIAGVSAGGFIALHHAYLDMESEIPEVIDQDAPGLGGGVEGESGNPGYSSEISGIVNIAGALISTDVMAAGDEPVCSFHGTEDGTVPFGSATLQLFGFPVTDVDGSETIHAQADQLGILNCFEIQEGQDHVPHTTNALEYDTLRSITSNFLSHLVCTDIPLDCEYRELEIVSSVDEFHGGSASLTAFPNPASDFLTLQGLADSERMVKYVIVDLSGREVRVGTLGQGENIIPVDDILSGVYLLHFQIGGAVVTERVVIE